VRLAKRAADLEPQNAFFWDTLGLAHYRAGDWPAALTAFRKAEQVQGRGSSTPERPFLLAVVHWRMNNKDQARKEYDRGVQWMSDNEAWLAKNATNRVELSRFRAEAADLLRPEETH
jgi:TolA-binding protein